MQSSGGGGVPSPAPDIQSKYTKLAAEYAKLRSQVGVLKRAVVDEQTKTCELTEKLQVRDQGIRKLEQEVDSLNFRNKQLEKRIGVLQSELSVEGSKGSKKKGPSKEESHSAPSTSSSLDYELISKIEENMLLQKQLSDLEISSQLEIEVLKSQLEARDNEDTHKELILNELTSLKSEHESLTCALQNSFDEIEAYREQVSQLREKISTKANEDNSITPNFTCESSTTSSSGVGGAAPPQQETVKSHSTHKDDYGSDEKIPKDLLEKLRESEERREYWTLEFQLLNMKYQRVIKKWEECKESLRSIGREDLLQSTNSELTTPVNENTNFLGRMEVLECEDEDDSLHPNYEKQLKEYMTLKVNELVGLLQYADSRALYFYNECKSMQSLVTIWVGKCSDLSSELEILKEQEAAHLDEFQVTKENYEKQLTQLTEHLAIMNDKIAEKQDSIQELQAKLKNSKK